MKPTVLHVLEAFAGGTEKHLLDIVHHVEDFAHVIAVPSSHHGASTAQAARAARSLGARVVAVEMSRSREAYRSLTAILTLNTLLRELGPDIVHGHSSIGGAVARLAAWPRSTPVVYTPHCMYRSRWALRVERLLSRRADRIIAVSEGEREFLLEQRVIDPERVVVIPNGIDLDRPPPPVPGLRAQLGVAPSVPLVGCVGRLTWQKAPEVYVQACALVGAQIPEAQFVLIGSGPLRRGIEQAIERAGLTARFHLVPSFPNAGAIVGELDLFVLPSRFEGGPYTPLEAMRGRTPVVVSDAPGNRDIVRDGVSGLVVAQEDAEALGGAMLRVLSDSELRESLVQGALHGLRSFDVRSMADATARLYRTLLEERELGPGALHASSIQLGVRGGAAVP